MERANLKYNATLLDNIDFLKTDPNDYMIPPSLMENVTGRFIEQFIKKRDGVIMEAFANAGLDGSDHEMIKEHVVRLIQDGDIYEHYYYKHGTSEEKRIISIQRLDYFPGISYATDYTNLTATCKYY